jgi:hypothetical protein
MIKLTPTSLRLLPSLQLRWKKGVKKVFMYRFKPSFRRRRREGGRAKQRPGESSLMALVRLYILYK